MNLIERTQVFDAKNNLTALVIDFQKALYDADEDADAEMFDALELKKPKATALEWQLMLFHQNINTYPSRLTASLKALLAFLNTEKMVVMAHLKLDLFGNLKHDYEKVIQAYAELSKITHSQTYKEAIEVNVSEIDVLVEILFWLERCDASVPEYMFWTDAEDRFCFYFCKYGNIHFVDFTNGNLITESALTDLGFITNEDYDQFSENGAIENRQLNPDDFK